MQRFDVNREYPKNHNQALFIYSDNVVLVQAVLDKEQWLCAQEVVPNKGGLIIGMYSIRYTANFMGLSEHFWLISAHQLDMSSAIVEC
jgi:hypothetical protein